MKSKQAPNIQYFKNSSEFKIQILRHNDLPHVSISSILVQVEILSGHGAGGIGQVIVETAAFVALIQIVVAIGIG